jgi:uncharacterized protein YecT (DUF1311 family)
MKKLPFIFIVPLLFNGGAFAGEACLQNAYTQAEMSKCKDITSEEADKELNRVYNAIKKVYQDDPKFLNALKKSQLAWLKFRDAEYETRYPGKDKQGTYGTTYSMCIDIVDANITIQRVIELKRWLRGVREGDVCAGSVKRPDAIQENLKKR